MPSQPLMVVEGMLLAILGLLFAIFPIIASKIWILLFRATFFWAPPVGRYYSRKITPRLMYFFAASFLIVGVTLAATSWSSS